MTTAATTTNAARMAEAPAGYLQVHDAGDVARHCALLAPVPRAAEVRVVATPAPQPGQWKLDVVARDRPGLLAAFTGVLAEARVDVVQAVLATWDDGAALEAFVMRSDTPPDVDGLEAAFAASLDLPLWSLPVADATVTFDHDVSDVYTACEVRAADRPGLLHNVAVAFAAAGADVHAARVVTVDGFACDRFDLSDGEGGKLDAGMEAAISAHVRDGVVLRRRRFRRFLRRRRMTIPS